MERRPLESLNFKSIEHVGNATWYLITKKYVYWSIAVTVVSVILLFYFQSFYILMIPFIYYAYFRAIAWKWFMQQFAKTNGMKYQEKLPMDSVKGKLFQIGNSRNIYHVVSTKYLDHSLRLFNYTYSIGSGKNRTTYNFTVAEIFFEKVEFPHILLQSKTMWRYGAKDKNQKRLSLEEEFKKDYYLYSKDGYEVEVFQIFTPEVLRYLKENGRHFSIEFAENRLYIYDDLAISNRKDLQNMYRVTKKIFDSIGALLNRLHDDFAVLHPYYKK
jgi:hypothetical protein